jgi:hypothetical protein
MIVVGGKNCNSKIKKWIIFLEKNLFCHNIMIVVGGKNCNSKIKKWIIFLEKKLFCQCENWP